MYITFALQADDEKNSSRKRAELTIRSCRKFMPDAKIVQLTNDTFPVLEEVDEVIRHPNNGDFIVWAFESLIKLIERGENVLQIATDIIINEDVSGVFEEDFDVAACQYPLKDRDDGAYCGDVNFIKPSGIDFWRNVLSYYKGTPIIQDGWEGGQTAFLVMAQSRHYNIKALDYNKYCRTPYCLTSDMKEAAIIHFRGTRKEFMNAAAVSVLNLCTPEEAGYTKRELNLFCNTPEQVIFTNVKRNSELNLEWVNTLKPHDGHAVICGSGASLIKTIPEIKQRKLLGQTIFALNGAGKVLMEYGIQPDGLIILDARNQNKEFLLENTKCYIASQCDPELFKIAGDNAILWHPVIPDIEEVIPPKMSHALVGGGLTVGLASMCLAYILGYRLIHLYGYDSCNTNNKSHANKQFADPKRSEVEVLFNNKWYPASQTMAKQAEFFPGLCNMLTERDCVITVHGEGLIPDIAKVMHYESIQLSTQKKGK